MFEITSSDSSNSSSSSMIISIVSISSIDVVDGRNVDVKSLGHNFEIKHETLIATAGTAMDMYMWQMVMSSVGVCQQLQSVCVVCWSVERTDIP
jgi:hypothetical protein